MKRRHFIGVSMARRVEVVRPRELRDVLEHAHPDDPPRRLNGAGWVVICTVAIGALLYVAGAVIAHFGGRL